jgi:hypothetical protein
MGDRVREIMQGFATRTGLEPVLPEPTRYLWTDAFAVCNFLGLHERESDDEALRLALRLVDQVHHTLGRHRPDDRRKGWISGLDEVEGALRPTDGGLRIGKQWPERGVDDPYDDALEWERDGQYFHYLTRWMHALERVAHVVHDPKYVAWARRLAKRAFEGFLVTDAQGSPTGLFWKMSIDLDRPLVPWMGQHDPLDGFLVYSRLQAAGGGASDDLRGEIGALREICRGRSWETDDALGLGGLMGDALALARLIANGVLEECRLLESLLDACRAGLETLSATRFLGAAAESRLPFRELGLSIGLRALPQLHACVDNAPQAFTRPDRLRRALAALPAGQALATEIERFWLDPRNRRSRTWVGHREINEVMLATSLAPEAYLGVESTRSSCPK